MRETGLADPTRGRPPRAYPLDSLHDRFATAVVTIGANGISSPIASTTPAYSWGPSAAGDTGRSGPSASGFTRGRGLLVQETGLVDPQGAASDGPTRSIRCVTSSRPQR